MDHGPDPVTPGSFSFGEGGHTSPARDANCQQFIQLRGEWGRRRGYNIHAAVREFNKSLIEFLSPDDVNGAMLASLNGNFIYRGSISEI